VSDLSPLAALTNLRVLYLEENQIDDISALVANSQAGGLGAGDHVYLRHNYLNLSETSKAMADIQALIKSGAAVSYSPQRPVVVNEETGILVAAVIVLIVVAARPGRTTEC